MAARVTPREYSAALRQLKNRGITAREGKAMQEAIFNRAHARMKTK